METKWGAEKGWARRTQLYDFPICKYPKRECDDKFLVNEIEMVLCNTYDGIHCECPHFEMEDEEMWNTPTAVKEE